MISKTGFSVRKPIFPGRKLKVDYNPWPTRYALPGDKSPERQNLIHFSGPQVVIAHALTFYEIPPDIDLRLDALPSNERLNQLGRFQKDYLSFLVYTLKQMIAAGTINAECAWELFFDQWGALEKCDSQSFNAERFISLRLRFLLGVNDAIRKNTNDIFYFKLRGRHFPTIGRDNNIDDRIKLEFLARAGEAGLEQHSKADEWANNLKFDPRFPWKQLIRGQYKFSLWLEMRIIESIFGFPSLNKGIEFFSLSFQNINELKGDLAGIVSVFNFDMSRIFSMGPGRGFIKFEPIDCEKPIDALIKEQIGNWMFIPLIKPFHWIRPLINVACASSYSSRVNLSYAEEADFSYHTPEQKSWLFGGYAPIVYGTKFHVFPYEIKNFEESLKIFEMIEEGTPLDGCIFERYIRGKIHDGVKQGIIASRESYAIYYRTLLYATLLQLQDWSSAEIMEKIERFDLIDINDYYDNRLEITRRALQESVEKIQRPTFGFHDTRLTDLYKGPFRMFQEEAIRKLDNILR